MRRSGVLELDMHKELRKYNDESETVLYPDSRYYRKNKPMFSLDDEKKFVSDSNRNANL